MTCQDALRYTISSIKDLYPADQAASIARWIVSWVTGFSSTQLITRQHTTLSTRQIQLLYELLHEHVVEHKPLQYLFGHVPFLGLDILVRPPLLIPRPETEYWCSHLISQLLPIKAPLVILDVCTGSGCIATALAHFLPHAKVYASDISPLACALASENALKNGSAVTVFQSDLFFSIPSDLRFDLIVSNPPYISRKEWHQLPESVKKWEDPKALWAPKQGLGLLDEIITQAPLKLKPHSELIKHHIPQLVVEIGYKQGKLVEEIFHKAGFTAVMVHQDLAGKDRFVMGEFHGNT